MVGVPIAAAICIRPELLEIATLAAAVAKMPLRRSVPVRSRRDARTAGGHDFLRHRLFAGAADDPDIQTIFGQKPRGFRIVGPAFGGADGARRQCHRRTRSQPVVLSPAAGFLFGNIKLGRRPFRRQRGATGQRQRGILVDKAGRAFSPHRIRLISPNLASPKKPTLSGMPANVGAMAAFQVRGRTSAVP